MINKYFIVVDSNDSILGIKKYRGLVDVRPDACFSVEPGTRLVQVPDREYFKIACFDEFIDPTIKESLDFESKAVAKWNIIRQEIEFIPCIECTFSPAEILPSSFASLVFDKKDMRVIRLVDYYGVKPHTISFKARHFETGNTVRVLVNTQVKLSFMEYENGVMSKPQDVMVDIINGVGEYTFPLPTSPKIFFLKISHPSFLMTNTNTILAYQ